MNEGGKEGGLDRSTDEEIELGEEKVADAGYGTAPFLLDYISRRVETDVSGRAVP